MKHNKHNNKYNKHNKPTRGIWPKDTWNSYQLRKEELLDTIFTRAEKLNISNAQLARMSNLSYTTICNLEKYITQQPLDGTIFKLCMALNIKQVLK